MDEVVAIVDLLHMCGAILGSPSLYIIDAILGGEKTSTGLSKMERHMS